MFLDCDRCWVLECAVDVARFLCTWHYADALILQHRPTDCSRSALERERSLVKSYWLADALQSITTLASHLGLRL